MRSLASSASKITRTIDHATTGDGEVPGPISQRLTEAYKEEADYDFAGQYLRHFGS